MMLTVRAASKIKATTRPGLARSAKNKSLTEAKNWTYGVGRENLIL